jgi:hypothetical protein
VFDRPTLLVDEEILDMADLAVFGVDGVASTLLEE